MIKCDICRSGKGVAVRYGEKSIVTMCPKCISEASQYATNQEMIFMITFMSKLHLQKLKCQEGKKFTDDCYDRITTFIWLRSFNEWLRKKRRDR